MPPSEDQSDGRKHSLFMDETECVVSNDGDRQQYSLSNIKYP